MAEEVGSAYLDVIAKLDQSSMANVKSQAQSAGQGIGGAMGKGLGAASVAMGNILSSMATQAANAVGQFAMDTLDAGKNFDSAMSQVAATMGITMDEMQNEVGTVDLAWGSFTGTLRDFAKEMGAHTAFSATQAAEALNYMALAGYDTATSMQMLPNVLNLAASGGMELATASDMVTDAQSALGLSLDETTVLVDQMAKTASTTNTSVSQLGDALLTVGGTAKMMKGGTAEMAQVLGLLADNGIKGSEGGTALRNILLSLSAPTDKAAAVMESLGLQVFDAEGNMRDMESIIGDLNAAMADMTDEEKTQAVAAIFNKRDLKSVNALLGTSAERWGDVASSIADAAGAAQQMADTQLDNMEGDITLFNSALEGLQISLYEFVEPALRRIVQLGSDIATGATTALGMIGPALEDFYSAYIKPFVDRIAKAMEENDIGPRIEQLQKLLQGFLDGVLKGIGAFLQATLLPIVDAVVGFIADHVIPMLADLEEFITGDVLPVFEQFVSWVQENIVPVLRAWVSVIFESVIPAILDLVGGIVDAIVPALRDLWDWFNIHILPVLQTFAGFISRYVAPVLSDLARFIVYGVVPAISSLASWVGNTLYSSFSWLIDILGGVWDMLSGIINLAGQAINAASTAASYGYMYDYSGYAYPIRGYATGGITSGPSLVGERGPEFVWPSYQPYLNRYADALSSRIGGGGGVTVTGNEFNVRDDSDIYKIAYELNTMITRQRGGALA